MRTRYPAYKTHIAICKFPVSRYSEGAQEQGLYTTNIIANILGLGWAATPAGLKAMESLSELNHSLNKEKAHISSKEMCTFLIINISSLQLIPVNIIAYRAQYGSVNPTAIVVPSIIATTASTVAAIIFCRIMTLRDK